MEILVDAADGSLAQDDVLLSVRFGGVRKQVPLNKASQTCLSFPDLPSRKDPKSIKFDVLSKIGSGWLMLRPGEECYKVPVMGCGASASMTVRIREPKAEEATQADAAATCPAAPASGDAWDGGTPSTRPGTADDFVPAPGVVRQGGAEQAPAEDAQAEAADRPARRRDRAQSAKDYLEQHQVITFVHALLHALLKERPGDPYAFMASHMPRADLAEKLPVQVEVPLAESPEPPPVSVPPSTPAVQPQAAHTASFAAIAVRSADPASEDADESRPVGPRPTMNDPQHGGQSAKDGEVEELRLNCALLKLQVRDLQRENEALLERLGEPSEGRSRKGSKGTVVETGATAPAELLARSLSPVRGVVMRSRRVHARNSTSVLVEGPEPSGSTSAALRRRPTLIREQAGEVQITLLGVAAGEEEDEPPPPPQPPADGLTHRARTELVQRMVDRKSVGVGGAPPSYISRNLETFWQRLRGETDAADEYRVLRQSVLTGRWTLYSAGGKNKKPHQYAHARRTPHLLEVPRCDQRCPFCVGNESNTPPPLLFFDQDGEMHESTDLPQGWLCRVIPNIFPLLVTPPGLYGEAFSSKLAQIPHSAAARGEHANDALFAMPQDPVDKDDLEGTTHRQVHAVGYSEVVIENPSHNGLLAIVDAKQVALSLLALQARGRVLSNQPNVRQLLYFKQYGANSGGSLVHPHMQIVTLPLLTPETQRRLERAVEFYHRFGKCSVCHCFVEEPLREDGHACSRLIYQSKHFMVVVPFASNQYRVSIAPKQHSASWLAISREEVVELAEVLQLVMEAFFHTLNDPEYNVYFVSIDKEEEVLVGEAMHWVLEVHPRFPAELGGVELASGIRVISGLPEDWAQQFRTAIQERLAVRRRRTKTPGSPRPAPEPALLEALQTEKGLQAFQRAVSS